MASLRFIQAFLFCLSLSVLIFTAWMITSGGGLGSRLAYRDDRCSCDQIFEDERSATIASESSMFVGKDSELSANNLAECREKMKTYKERLDWEISRGDWRSTDIDAGSQEIRENCNGIEDINIIVNGKRTINGFSTNEGVFVPFSAVKEEFEIEGNYNSKGVFEWRNAVIKAWAVPDRYDPTGPYVGLENAVVEHRKRVKCIDGLHGVPVTTQWDKRGYFYATQIAQYGLAHYSKFLNMGSNKNKKILNQVTPAQISSDNSEIRMVYTKEKGRNVTHFKGKVAFHKKVILNQTRGQNILSLEVKLEPGSEIVVGIKKRTHGYINLRYIEDHHEFVSCSHSNVKFGIGHIHGWRTLTRDLQTDLVKGLAACKDLEGGLVKFEGIHRLSVLGSGYIGDVTVSTSAHDEMFLSAAQWLLKFQDAEGGWPVNVTRRIIPQVVSSPGWRSAMGSGQAISLLCRAYSYTKQLEYLEAAIRALKLFHIPVSKKGFVSTVMGDLKMFEEYALEPSLHVLNGFIFALIGLYDLSKIKQDDKTARHLFDAGLKTLVRILPMYDNGRGTFYDLRHVVIPGVEPKRARWDYHAVHLGQLQLLKVITHDSVIDKILTRWRGYVEGVPARHN